MTTNSAIAAILHKLNLPVAAIASDVCDELRVRNVVLQAEPGAGKSTGLPLALLDAGFDDRIVMLEPRRIAAKGVASRLASHLGEPVGKTIGLRMRGQTRVSASTRLEVVTEGVLTRMLQSDPLLEGVSVVVFDEFHERSIHADLGLALCLDVQRSVREDLRLLMMSATLDTGIISPHVNAGTPFSCSVRQHDVQIIWHGEVKASLQSSVANIVKTALAEHSGDILVFLPGIAEIERCAKLITPIIGDNVQLHRLHSSVSSAQQSAATASRSQLIKEGKATVRRVILSTNIAETSITIDGVCVVVDSGVERRLRVDRTSGAERLETVTASRASAKQRAGRAGRTQAGVCYRLWSEAGHATRAQTWQAEILRADLTALVADLGQWGVTDLNSLPWIDAPPEASVKQAVQLLAQLGMWSNNQLTSYGRKAMSLGLHPRIGHMLLWSHQQGCTAEACRLAAVVEDLSRTPDADLSTALSRLSNTHKQRAQQLAGLLGAGQVASSKPSAGVMLAYAFPDRIAGRRSSADSRYLLSSGVGAVLNADDSLAQSQWLVVAHMGGSANEARIFAALPVDITELYEWCKDFINDVEQVYWDDQHERVVAEQRQCIGELVLQSRPLTTVSQQQIHEGLAQALRLKGLQTLAFSDDVVEWLARVERMRTLQGGDSEFPDLSDDCLLATLDEWLLPFAPKVNSLKALRRLDHLPMLSSLLDYRQQQQLDEWLPVKFTVPSGSKISLQYACEGNPVLAVKLQEMFGCRENPAVAGGRLPLKVQLLSPAQRPVQITEDLANFWVNSYPAVKKDLAGRYPKHPWPDDPLNSTPTRHTKKRLMNEQGRP